MPKPTIDRICDAVQPRAAEAEAVAERDEQVDAEDERAALVHADQAVGRRGVVGEEAERAADVRGAAGRDDADRDQDGQRDEPGPDRDELEVGAVERAVAVDGPDDVDVDEADQDDAQEGLLELRPLDAREHPAPAFERRPPLHRRRTVVHPVSIWHSTMGRRRDDPKRRPPPSCPSPNLSSSTLPTATRSPRRCGSRERRAPSRYVVVNAGPASRPATTAASPPGWRTAAFPR
jgi:hypothetical protein